MMLKARLPARGRSPLLTLHCCCLAQQSYPSHLLAMVSLPLLVSCSLLMLVLPDGAFGQSDRVEEEALRSTSSMTSPSFRLYYYYFYFYFYDYYT